jgi:hypothetical protein
MGISGSQPALMYAQAALARAGATRAGFISGQVFLTIGGVHVGFGAATPPDGVLLTSLSVTDHLDETPNRCTFRTRQRVPTAGSEVVVTLGSKNSYTRVFAGHAVNVAQAYVGQRPANRIAEVAAVDYTWLLGFVHVTKRYVNQSASTIATDLITTYGAANGFTTIGIAAGLPTVDEITYTNEDLPNALTRLARRIGGYWYVDYRKDVHLFITSEVRNGAPVALTATHRSLAAFTVDTDRSQVLTRVFVEGRGSTVLAPVAVGETRVPLEAVDMFAVDSDVFAKVSFQGSSGAAQHVIFGGVVSGGRGSLVGPGIGPSGAPTATAKVGTGVDNGEHSYVVTFVTAAGESLPSPPGWVSTGQVPNPTIVPTGWTPPSNYFAELVKLGLYKIKYAYSTDHVFPSVKVTLASPPSATIQANTNSGIDPPDQGAIQSSIPCSPSPAVTYVQVYRTVNGGNTFYLATFYPNQPGTTINYSGVEHDATLVNQPLEPSVNTAGGLNQIDLSNIPLGSAAVTARKIYRTIAGGGQLKLLATIANNTATTYTDTTPDASLGAAPPTVDTSGLGQPDGQVVAGATLLPVSGTSAFEAGGGWAIIGNGEQIIRYTGLTASALVGIPATGVGAITATIAYNSTITTAPMLTGLPATGVGALADALTVGDEVYLVVQVEDGARQAQLALGVGGPGIREEWVQDRRLSITEARARGAATLAARPLDVRTVAYRCRDLRTASGKTITVNLPAPTSVSGAFKIQQVRIDNFRPHANQYPTFTVQASSERFSFEDLLRSFKAKE